MYLVDPQGGRYDLGPAPADATLSDFSGDGTRALFESNADSSSQTVSVVDLQNGSTTAIPLNSGGNFRNVEFSKPDGLAVVFGGINAESGPVAAERLSLTGTVQQVYPTSFPQAGDAVGTMVESPDGTQLVMETDNGEEVVDNSGQPIRFLADPPGQQACELTRWWGDGDVLLNCGTQLWLQPASGTAPTALTSSANTESDINAWQLPDGTYAEGAACGTTWLSKIGADGVSTHLSVPGTPTGGSVAGIGADGDQMAILLTGGCDGGPGSAATATGTLAWYNPATNVVSALLGTSLNGGVVDGAVMLPFDMG
jgi:hypothetical protein